MREGGSRSVGRSLQYLRMPLYVAPAVALLLSLACTARSQSQSGNSGSGVPHTTMGGNFPQRSDMGPLATDEYDPMITERRLRALNMERQKEMVSDTNKLLKLARELNAEVAGQKAEMLTPDQLHKIAEIEKLARNVRERMTSAVGETQTMIPPASIVYPVH
jgi:hypothetical protein